MYKALNYVIRHYEELTAYLDIPEMPLDNNDTEREIRAMVMGKKAYLWGRYRFLHGFFGKSLIVLTSLYKKNKDFAFI